MKLIKHLFEGIGDYILLGSWIITVILGFYFIEMLPLTAIFSIFIAIWLWMGIHFWRAENKMFDRYKLRSKLLFENHLGEEIK